MKLLHSGPTDFIILVNEKRNTTTKVNLKLHRTIAHIHKIKKELMENKIIEYIKNTPNDDYRSKPFALTKKGTILKKLILGIKKHER